MRTRTALAGALLAVALVPGTGQAAPTKTPQIVDAKTDAVGGQAGTEIISVLWTTTGDTTVTRVRGKRKVVYTPRKLVVTMNLAGAPGEGPLAYETSAVVGSCGTVRFTYTPGTVFSQVLGESSLWYDCGPEDPTTGDTLVLVSGVSHKIGAKSMTWEYPIKGFPKSVRAGVAVSEFRAAVDIVDPVFGLEGTTTTNTPIDEGTGDRVWKLGS